VSRDEGVTPLPYGEIVSEKQTPCPNCGADRVRPVAYGYPGEGALEQWERDDVVVGGCVIDSYSSPFMCRECDVGVWPHRMFHEGTAFRIELAPSPDRVDARVLGGALWVEWVDDRMLFVPAGDFDTLLLALLVEVADDGERFAGWLRYRGLGFDGEANGSAMRFTIDSDAVSVIDRSGGALTVRGATDRLVLYLLRTFVVDQGVGLDGLSTWLDDLGIRYARLGP